MIAVKLQGRLGIQLFQYALIYNVAKILGTTYYIDKSIQDYVLQEYFEIKKDFLYLIDKHFFTIKDYKNIFNYYLKKMLKIIYNVYFLKKDVESNEFKVIKSVIKIP